MTNRPLFRWRFAEVTELAEDHPHFVKGDVVVVAEDDVAARVAAGFQFQVERHSARASPWLSKQLLSCTNEGPAGDSDEDGAVYLNGIRMKPRPRD